MIKCSIKAVTDWAVVDNNNFLPQAPLSLKEKCSTLLRKQAECTTMASVQNNDKCEICKFGVGHAAEKMLQIQPQSQHVKKIQ